MVVHEIDSSTVHFFVKTMFCNTITKPKEELPKGEKIEVVPIQSIMLKPVINRSFFHTISCKCVKTQRLLAPSQRNELDLIKSPTYNPVVQVAKD